MTHKLFLASGVLAGVLGLGGPASRASADDYPGGCGVRPPACPAPVVLSPCAPPVVEGTAVFQPAPVQIRTLRGTYEGAVLYQPPVAILSFSVGSVPPRPFVCHPPGRSAGPCPGPSSTPITTAGHGAGERRQQ